MNLVSQSPTVAEIDVTAFKENIRTLKAHIKHCLLLAVIKTNAYGHGIVPIGQAAIDAGAERLGVTAVEEGAMLRENGIDVPIHILSSVTADRAADIVYYGLTASISDQKLAHAISEEAIKQHTTASVHLKMNTGLQRFGIDPMNMVDFCQSCYHLPGLQWEGIYTHFSSADEADWVTTKQQFTLFENTVMNLERYGYDFPLHHVGGSTIAIERNDMLLDMVRPGIALFGYPPAPRQCDMITLQPVMTLKSRLLHVRKLPPNTPVGYGGSYVTSTREKIAIVPIGHGDGYQRALSNRGEMLVRGKRAPIVGTISLDQTLIDVTNIPDVREGDEVVLLGKQGDEEINAREIAGWMNSIVDEVLSGLMERIRRKYM